MKTCKIPVLLSLVLSSMGSLMFFSSLFGQLPGENFTPKRVVNANTAQGRFRHPFAMVMGPNDSLWITERRGYVIRMNRSDGTKTTLLNIRSKVKFSTTVSGGNVTGISQDGVFGIALHPELNQGTGNDFVYLAYCYDSSGQRRTRVVRFQYTQSAFSGNDTLSNETVLLHGIWGSNDHNGGRLVIGDFGTAAVHDYKLMYSVGDRGANQFSNACDSIESQYLPTSAQWAARDIHRYNGKILRMNLDGSVPNDNPYLNGVQTHVWSYGHRNPQGLSFEKDINNTLVPRGRLYESEQGPATSDEVNIIDSGYNYGWPRVAGKRDDVWYKYYQWSSSVSPPCTSFGGECSAVQNNNGLIESSFTHGRYQEPVFDLFPGAPPTVGGVPNTCNWLTYTTIAPSSILYYPYSNRIPGWDNSLLITTLKNSSVYRLRLNAAGTAPLAVTDTVVRYFYDVSALNRYRDIAVASDGISFYLLTDSIGATSGPSAGSDGGLTNRGCVLEFRYVGAVLSQTNPPVPVRQDPSFRVYPNPAESEITVEGLQEVAKPLYYSLVDVSGRKVMQGSSFRSTLRLSLNGIRTGVYVLVLQQAQGGLLYRERVMVK